MNATSFAAAWVPVLLGTTTEGLRQYLSFEYNLYNISPLQLDPWEKARLSRQLPSKGPVTYFLFARLLYCHFYALVSVRDTFWDRASHDWLGKQTISVADTFLAHAAGISSTAKARELRRMAGETRAQLLCSPHPLARALAAHRPGRPVSCLSLTTEMLDAPSRGATFLYRDRWQRVPDHVHWVPVGENPSCSAFMTWLLLDFERGHEVLPRHCELWCTLPASVGSVQWPRKVSDQAAFKAMFADPSRLAGAVFEYRYGWQTQEPEPRGTASTWSSAPSPVSSPAYSPSSSRSSSRSPSPIVHRSNSPAAAAVSLVALDASSALPGSRSNASTSDVCEPCDGCSMDIPNASRCSLHPWVCRNVPT